MSTYAFRAIDVAGTPSRGELEAATKGQVTEQLRQRGLIVLDVSEKHESIKVEGLFDRFQSVSMRNLSVFSRQFATLIASGMPMLRSLYTLEDQTEDEKITAAIVDLRSDVEAGSSVADSMERNPAIFDPLYRSMVRAGEGSGRLEQALDMVAVQLEKLDSLKPPGALGDDVPDARVRVRGDRDVGRRRLHRPRLHRHLRGALTGLGRAGRAAVHDPDHGHRLGSAHRLPGSSSFRASAARFLAFFQWKKTERGRYQWDAFKLKLPAKIGDVVQKVAIARWSRVFSGTIAAGVPILQAVRIAGETSGNAVVAAAMEDVYSSVRQGGTIAAPLGRSDVFPTMVTHMVSVGEETGQLEQMLGKIADFYEAEVDAKIKALTSLIEPMMIIFVGGVVGFIVISMYLPIFSLYDKIR